MTTYKPELGDLVFFEPNAHWISGLVADLSGQPIPDLRVSHCAIVSEVSPSGGVTVIENKLEIDEDWHEGKPIGGSRPSSLAEICTEDGPRRLLVIRRGTSSASAVDTAAAPWLGRSDYSIPLLLLAALASLLRALPCSDERKRYWKLVHRHARAIDDRARTGGPLEGTCAGTVATIETCAGQPLGIKEPDCPKRRDVWRRGAHMIEQIEAMAMVAWLEARRAGKRQVIAERVMEGLHEAEARPPKEQEDVREPAMAGGGETTGPPPDDAGEASPSAEGTDEERFGPDAAKWVRRQLRHVLVVRRIDQAKVLRDLLITFHVLDELLDAPPDWREPPGPDDDVFLPLMPLDLILAKFKDQVLGPFDPYTVR